MTDIYGHDTQASTTPIPLEELTPRLVRDAWDRGLRATRQEREQAAVNQRFLLNRHWVFWNRGTGRLEEMPRHPDRVRATIARIGPDSRRIMSKLMRRALQFEVAPRTPDDASIQASRIAEAALVEVAREQNWESLRVDHGYTVWGAGVGGVCVEWDYQMGTPIGVDDRGQLVYTGDIKLSVVALSEMACEPGTRDIEKGRWWIKGLALPPAEVQEMYNMENTPPGDARAVDTVWRMSEGERSTDTPLTMVLTYFERPNGLQPGRVATVVDNEFVDQTGWPFPFSDRLNVASAVVEPIHARWYGHTPVTDAVPVQAMLNASWSSIIEHVKQSGNARLWVPMGSVDDIEDLSDLAGEAVEYTPINGLKPSYEAPPTMPDWWSKLPGSLGDAMDDILGQHDVSRGESPTGIESGIALSILSENDDTPIGQMARNLGDCWGRVASMVLALYEVNVQNTRTAMVSQPNSDIPEVIEWSGPSLMGHTTATVPTDSVMPRSRAAQAAYAMQLFDRGIITTPGELAKIADLPDQDDLLAGIDPDTARAQRENNHMASGKARTVDVIDDHMNHLVIHRNFVRSARYEMLQIEYQQICRDHMAAHELYAAQQAAAQAMAAGISPLAAALPTEATAILSNESIADSAAISAFAPAAPTAAPGIPE